MRLAEMFLNALYPRGLTCDLCGRDARFGESGPAAYLCPACLALLRPAPALSPPDGLDGAAAGLLYTPEAARLMHRFKYGQGRYLAETFTAFLPLPEAAFDCILAVPLYPAREKRRGYNQSALLARCISTRTGIPVDSSLLLRTRDTASQTTLDHEARARNVRGAFRPGGEVKGLSFLLVDDVFTTGATLGECAKTLKAAGADKVYALAACAAELCAGGPYADSERRARPSDDF